MALWNRKKDQPIEQKEKRSYNLFNRSSLFSHTDNTEVSDEILKIAEVQDCIDKLVGGVSQLPLAVYKQDENGNTTELKKHYLNRVLDNKANPYYKSYNLKETIVRDLIIKGSHYSYLDRKYNDVQGIYPTQNATVYQAYNKRGLPIKTDIEYTLNDVNAKVDESNFLIIARNSTNGFLGEPILKETDTLSLMLKQNETLRNVFNNISRPLGIFETDGTLSDEQFEGLEKQIENMTNIDIAKNLLLENGVKYKTVNLDLGNLNLTENKSVFAKEIYTMFGLEGVKDRKEFLEALQPMITLIEESLTTCLLTEMEKEDGVYIRFKTSEFLRTSDKEQAEVIDKLSKNGVLSVNEGRARLDLPPLEKDYLMFSLGNVFYDKDKKEFIVPNMGQTMGENNMEVTQDGANTTNNKV